MSSIERSKFPHSLTKHYTVKITTKQTKIVFLDNGLSELKMFVVIQLVANKRRKKLRFSEFYCC